MVGYTYSQVHVGVTQATVCLNHAQVLDGHAAVWLGAENDQNTEWIQAGIGVKQGTRPFIYIEYTIKGVAWSSRIKYVPYGTCVKLAMKSRGRWWHITLDGQTLGPSVALTDATLVAAAETYDDSTVSATIRR